MVAGFDVVVNGILNVSGICRAVLVGNYVDTRLEAVSLAGVVERRRKTRGQKLTATVDDEDGWLCA